MMLNSWFEKGMTFEQYLSSMKVNQEDVTNVYEKLEFTEQDIKFFEEKLEPKNVRGIVLTADWCGDAALNVPILQRIAEKSNIELRYLIRDDNLELMDQYLTNGTARAIPIFVFIDEQGNESFVWGPRSKEVQDMVTSGRAKLPPADSPDFKEKQQQFYTTFRNRITTEPPIWRTVIESVKEKL